MTEVVVDTDAGKRRRLPMWMLRANSASEIRNHGVRDRSCSLSEEKTDVQDAARERTCTTRLYRSKPAEATNNLDEFETVGRREARQRTRKASRTVGEDDSFTNYGISKTKTTEKSEGVETTVDNGVATKNKSRKSKRPKNNEVVCSPVMSDNEFELTVEDLVRIAEEHVNADREKQHECSTAREHKSVIHTSSSSVSSRASMGGPVQMAGSSQALSRCTTMSTSSNLADTQLYEESNPQVEKIVINVPRTGDAARDMLDLLLGPLLVKPRSEEHETREVITESMILTHKAKQPSNSSKEIWKGEALLTKRKSSLKDKVALLLD